MAFEDDGLENWYGWKPDDLPPLPEDDGAWATETTANNTFLENLMDIDTDREPGERTNVDNAAGFVENPIKGTYDYGVDLIKDLRTDAPDNETGWQTFKDAGLLGVIEEAIRDKRKRDDITPDDQGHEDVTMEEFQNNVEKIAAGIMQGNPAATGGAGGGHTGCQCKKVKLNCVESCQLKKERNEKCKGCPFYRRKTYSRRSYGSYKRKSYYPRRRYTSRRKTTGYKYKKSCK